MSGFAPIAIYIILAVIVLGTVGILAFGLRSVVQGKAEPITIGVMAVPAVLFLLLGLIMSSWAMAAMWTTLIMFGLGLLALFSSGLWGLFT